MAKLRNVVYLTKAQKDILFTPGGTVGGISYDANDLYIVLQLWDVDGSASDYLYIKDSGGVERLRVANNGMVRAAGFEGSGALLTNLSASSITSGTIDMARLPAIAITDRFVYNTPTDFETAYSANHNLLQKGDVVIFTTNKETYIHNGGTAWSMSDLTKLETPTDLVASVNGKAGAVVIGPTDIAWTSSHRTVTDTEKTTWNNKSDAHTHPYRSSSWVPSWSEVTGKIGSTYGTTAGTFAEGNHIHTIGYYSTAAVSDLNTTLGTGQFSWHSGSTNTPVASSFGQGINIVSAGTAHNNLNNWITQLAFSTENNKAYFRGKTNGGSWGTWHTFYHTGNKPTASDITGLDATHRWLTDTYISTWNAKSDAHTHPYRADTWFPAASEVTGLDATHRWLTDAYISTWNAKEPAIGTKNTAFNKNYGTTATDVKMNGTQAVGSVDAIARIDHVHPTDTSRAADNAVVKLTGDQTIAGTKTFSSTITGSVSGNAGTATKLATARTISLGTGITGTATGFDGSSNITIPVTSISEAYLAWGGKSLSGSYGPIDAAMVDELGANRFAFYPENKILVEYSLDAGVTWLDYEATQAEKANLFNGIGTTLRIGKNASTGIDYTNYRLRVTLNGTQGSLYTSLNKFVILASTNGSGGTWVTIEGRLQSDIEASNNTWIVFSNQTPISGWSGYNIINISGFTTYGNSNAKPYQYGEVRFIFGGATANTSYSGLQILKILGFGGVGWSTPSNLAKSGNIYSYNHLQEVVFPAKVTAITFVGALTGTASGNLLNTHAASGVTTALISQWNTAYGWGNHASAGYAMSGHNHNTAYLGISAQAFDSLKLNGQLASYYQPASTAMTTSHAANGITSTNISNWNTAHGWGNHAGLYRPVAWVPSWSDVSGKPNTFAPIIGSGAADAVAGNDPRLTDSRPASDVYGWAKAASKPSYNFSEIGSKPTTLSGYGITDGMTATAINSAISTAISNLVASSPATLDTLNELAVALGNDPAFATTMTNLIGTKVTANTAITGATKTKITYDAKGLVTGGADLVASDIPPLAYRANTWVPSPSDITWTSSYRTVTDTEKSTWNAKSDAHTHPYRADTWVPSASQITGLDATHRWLTDAYISTWNAKSDAHTHPYLSTSHAASGVTNTRIVEWDAAYTHSDVDHAPSDAQKNSDITKAEIEAKLTGAISTHTHAYLSSTHPAKDVTAGLITDWNNAKTHSTTTTGSVHGSTTLGGNFLRLANTNTDDKYVRINYYNNDITLLNAENFRMSIGAQAASTAITTSNISSQTVANANNVNLGALPKGTNSYYLKGTGTTTNPVWAPLVELESTATVSTTFVSMACEANQSDFMLCFKTGSSSGPDVAQLFLTTSNSESLPPYTGGGSEQRHDLVTWTAQIAAYVYKSGNAIYVKVLSGTYYCQLYAL